jgi:hypothetical protein
MNSTQLARRTFFAWQQAMEEQGVSYFRDKHRGDLLRMTSSNWDGWTGRVRCRYLFKRGLRESVIVDYTVLEPLTDMEVLALSTSFETDH